MSSRRASRRVRRAEARKAIPGARGGQAAPTLNTSAIVGAISAGLIALVLVVFGPVRKFQFISLDDPQYVSANAQVLKGLTASGLKWAMTTTSFYWHPLTWVSHMTDVELFGMDAGAHHFTNIVIHAASTVLLFLAMRSMTRASWKSAFIAALFAIHPLHVESVAWVAERKDVLSTFFWMLGLLVYSKYVSRPSIGARLALTVVFGVGLLAKPMIVTFPFVLLLLDVWPLHRAPLSGSSWRAHWTPLIVEKIPLFVLSVFSVVMTLLSQRGTHAVVSLETLPWSARIGNAVVSYVLYMRDMIWPSGLAAFYPLHPPDVTSVVVAAALLAGMTVAVVFAARKLPFLLTGWLWYLGTLVPVIGFVQAGDQGRADRFTYVPLIGLFIVVTWLASSIFESSREGRLILAGIGTAIVIALSLASSRQVQYWRDDLSLWGRVVSVTTGNYRAENLYGVALTNRGQLDEGVKHYEAALRIWPDDPAAHNNLGTARMDQGRFTDAVREFKLAQTARPNDMNYRYNLVVALNAGGLRDEAVKELDAALKMNPRHPDLLRAREVIGSRE
jgi:hypothetical protein